MRGTWRCGVALLCLAGTVLTGTLGPAGEALAQIGLRPGDERPELEEFPPEQPPPTPLELPPIPPAPEEEPLSAGRGVFIRAFRVEGSTVFSAEELARVTAPYTGRAISSEELLDLRDAITAYYVERGYLSSGATIPDQSVEEGVVRIQVVEGAIAEVVVEGTRCFRPHYFRSRLRRAGRAPVDVARLEQQLQRFQRDPRVERVHATLLPGRRRGESVLTLVVQEARPYALALGFANDQPPSVGSLAGYTDASYANLLGHADELSADFTGSRGLRDVGAHYALPLNRFDTRLDLDFRTSESDVVEEPFDELDIFSEARSYGIGLSHPIHRTPTQELWLGITGEYRESEAFLLGEPFCFLEGAEDCKSKVSVLRLFQDWSWRTRSDVIAARSTVNLGLNALGSTVNDGAADSRFVGWLGQVQWAHRLPDRLLGAQLLARVDVQLADDPLLSLEKFEVGGSRTVRGYRENQLVRDNGVVASLELRVPLLRGPLGRPLVQLAPFADFGRAWDNEGGQPTRSIASLGVGLRLSPWEWLRAEAYWGGRLKRVEKHGDDLQDHGFHFRLTVAPFEALP
jgi:hemolysin activation/secretion protein